MHLVGLVNGQPVVTSDAARVIPPAVRRLVAWRDGGCTIDGCRSRYRLQVHHIKPRAGGGGHDPDNLTTSIGDLLRSRSRTSPKARLSPSCGGTPARVPHRPPVTTRPQTLPPQPHHRHRPTAVTESSCPSFRQSTPSRRFGAPGVVTLRSGITESGHDEGTTQMPGYKHGAVWLRSLDGGLVLVSNWGWSGLSFGLL